MKKLQLISIIFIGLSLAFAQTTQIDPNLLKQIVEILQKLTQQAPSSQPQPSTPIGTETLVPTPANLPKGIQPAIPATQVPLTPEVIKPILPDENREDDAIVQLNNLRITRILKDPGIENTKAIFFAVRDVGWKCLMFESEESEKTLPCVLNLRRPISLKELAIKITDDTILLQRNRQKAKLDDFNVGDKINIYGFMDKDSYGVDALIVRKISATPIKETKLKVISPNGGEIWAIDSYQKIIWRAPRDKTVSIYLKHYIPCLYNKPKCLMPEPMPIVIAENIANTSEYTWQVGNFVKKFEDQTLSPGYYLIEILGNQSGEIDESDKPFQIVYTQSQTPQEPRFCIQVITPAYNPQNPSECKEFPTPCYVPEGWIRTKRCPMPMLQSTSSQIQTTQLVEFKVEADDYGFYPSFLEVTKGAKVILTFYVRNENVYYGGLEFRSEKFKTNSVKPGQSTKIEFVADKDFIIESYWPLSNIKKAELKVVVK